MVEFNVNPFPSAWSHQHIDTRPGVPAMSSRPVMGATSPSCRRRRWHHFHGRPHHGAPRSGSIVGLVQGSSPGDTFGAGGPGAWKAHEHTRGRELGVHIPPNGGSGDVGRPGTRPSAGARAQDPTDRDPPDHLDHPSHHHQQTGRPGTHAWAHTTTTGQASSSSFRCLQHRPRRCCWLPAIESLLNSIMHFPPTLEDLSSFLTASCSNSSPQRVIIWAAGGGGERGNTASGVNHASMWFRRRNHSV